jgi:hypothetical protein
MEDINNFSKYNNLKLYKDGSIKFINLQINQDNKWNKVKSNLSTNLDNLDYTVGTLFLTEMNRNCKNNNISAHGYYISCALINLFSNIRNKLLLGKKISNESIIFLFNNIANNVEYLNSRIDSSNNIKKKINENLSNLITEISPLINDIVYFKKKHSPSQNLGLGTGSGSAQIVWEINNGVLDTDDEYSGACNKNCYTCWVDEILTKFNYVLLIIAKFMGTGITRDPNLYKLAEYYSNIFYTVLKFDSINISNNKNGSNPQTSTTNPTLYQSLFSNYQDYKSKLIYSNMELEINSDTIDEIINYLDNDIMSRFLNKKISVD